MAHRNHRHSQIRDAMIFYQPRMGTDASETRPRWQGSNPASVKIIIEIMFTKLYIVTVVE